MILTISFSSFNQDNAFSQSTLDSLDVNSNVDAKITLASRSCVIWNNAEANEDITGDNCIMVSLHEFCEQVFYVNVNIDDQD